MELVESRSGLKNFYYRYIQEPFLKIKERWLAYFAGFAIDDEPSASDIETEIQSSETIHPKKERATSATPEVPDQSRLILGRFAFISISLGATFGLGHIWRFPSLAYKYGGGAFSIIYVVSTLFFGYALYFMEVALGQYSSKGTLTIFERVPLLQGVGYSIIVYGYVVSTYYSQVVSFGINYFATSFESGLPWASCPAKETDANETMCFTVKYKGRPNDMDLKCLSGVLVVDLKILCEDDKYAESMKDKCCPIDQKCEEFNKEALCRRRQHPSAFYWTTEIIRQHSPTDSMRWHLDAGDLKILACTFAAWFLIYILVSAGIKWTGIIGMTVMPLTLVGLVLMIPVSVGVEGAVEGIIEFFVPHLEDFYKSEIWYAALSHAFFSLGVAMGPSYTLGSLSKFRNPCHIDTLLVSLCVVVTSILSGVVVFSMAGYISEETAIEFYKSSTQGSGTSIIAYSDILAKFPLPWLSTAVFFFLFSVMIALSVSSLIMSISASISEVSKTLRRDRHVVNFFLVFSSFLLSLPMVLREGVIIFSCIDNFTVRIVLPLICMFEILTFFVYDLRLLREDITFMIGSYPSPFFTCSFLLCPPAVIAAFMYKFVNIETTQWLHWTKITQLIISGIILCPIFFVMIGNVIKYAVNGNLKGIVRSPAKPAPSSEELQLTRMEFQTRRTIF